MKSKVKFDAIIQARMSSYRMPGKVMKKIKSKPILWYQIQRLKKIQSVKRIFISTTDKKTDDVIEKFCKQNDVNCFRGSEKNCIKRIVDTIMYNNLENIIFLTGDCPIIDVKIIQKAMKLFNLQKYEYVGNSFVRSYPDGMDVQIFKKKTILKAYKLAKSKLQKEHVTLSIKQNSTKFKILNFTSPKNVFYPELGLTLDQKEDFDLIKKILSYFLNKNFFFSCLDIINLLKNKPEWVEINRHVKRKGDN
jgi:spore coat polysaccharide biosynthesis protein SpsF